MLFLAALVLKARLESKRDKIRDAILNVATIFTVRLMHSGTLVKIKRMFIGHQLDLEFTNQVAR